MWLPYNEHYLISSEGEVKSIQSWRGQNERILKPFRMGNYLGVWIGAGNKQYIHRLVAELFCPRVDSCRLEVDHINRNKHDNRACNLRWVRPSDNMKNRGSFVRREHTMTRYGKEFIVKEHRVNAV